MKTALRRIITFAVSLSLTAQPFAAAAASYVYQVPFDAPDMSAAASGSLQAFPGSHNFGTLVLGSTAATSTIIQNVGQDSVTVTGIDIPAPFSQTNNCPATLVGGASCVATVVFNPSAAGSFSGALTVSTSSGSGMAFGVSGTAVVPTTNLTVSPNQVNFGASNVGVSAATQTVTVTNAGNSPATVNGVGVTSGASDFAESNDCGSELAPGASCTVSLSFTPTAYGARSGNLSIYEQASGTLYSVALSGSGNAAVLAVSPASPSWPDTIVDFPTTALVTVTNTGNLPLLALAANVSGPDASFSVADSQCGASLAAGASCAVTLRFAPFSAGTKTGTLTVASSNGGNRTVALSATGVARAPAVTASPTAVSFAAREVGSTSAQQTVTLTNSGNIPVTLSGLSVVAGASDFAQTNNCASLAVGGTCTINVQFTPSLRGQRTGTVFLRYDSTDLAVSLTGQGLQGEASLSASAVDFGSIQVGQAAPAQTVTLTNTGDAPLVVQSATVPASDFQVSSGCTTVPAGGTCTLALAFTPSALGVRTQSMTVTTDAGSRTVSLQGTGIKGNASVSPSALSFAVRQVATSSAAQTVTVTNTGTSALTFSGVGIVTGAADFAQSNDCSTVAVNGSCSVNVSFTPSAAGARSGVLALTHNGDGVTTVSLGGTGQDASATLGGGSFASTQVGSSSDATAVLSNTGIGALSVTVPTAASVTGTDFSFVSTTCTSSLAAGGSCNIVVRFSPSGTTARSGTLSVATGAGPQALALSSTGVQGTASVSPTSLTYAMQQVASTSAAQTVTVTNTGTSALTFSGISVVSGASDFAQNNDCASVPVNGTCSIAVSFTPSAAGARSGTLALTHDGAGLTTVSLSGSGQPQMASLSTPAFPVTAVGSSSTATATLTNDGIGALSVTVPTSTSVTGTDFSFVSTTCGTSVAPSGSCTVTVRFSPSGTTARSGALSVATGAGLKTVTFGSTGIQGYASMSPSSLTYSVQQTGTTSGVQTVTVTNTGTDTLTFSGVGISAGASDFAQSNNCGSVAVGGTCTVNVNFTPSAAGPRAGTLSFTHNGGGIANVSLSGTGQAASATLSTPGFPTTQVGQNATATATLTNTGMAAIGVTTPTAASVTGTDFSFVSTTCGTSLGAGATCTVTVRFSPTAAGARTGNLSFSTGAGTQSVALNGTGATASLVAISGSSAGTTLAPQSTSGNYFSVQNNGYGPVTLTGTPSGSGALSVWTQVASGWCSNGLVLNAGDSCVVYGYFYQNAGSYSGVASWPSTAGTLTQTITGTVVGNLNVAGAAYGDVSVGSTKDLTVVVSNSATTTARNMTYAAAAPFSIVANGCAVTLGAGTSCNLTVRYSPTAQGAVSGNYVTVTGQFDRVIAGTADSSSPSSVITSYGSLSGNGSQAVTNVSPASVAFGNVQVGQTVTSASFTVSNTGNAAATTLAVNPGAGYSVTSNTCAATLNAGSSCTFALVFSPTAAQSYNNNATITSSAGTQTIVVTGTGTSPSLYLSGYRYGGNSALGVVGVYSDSGRWPTYTNNGSGPVVIQSHSATGGFWAWGGATGGDWCYVGLVVPAGGSCSTFNGISAGVGDYSGAATMTYTAQGQSTEYSTGVPSLTASVRTTTANVGSVAFGTVPQNQWNGPQTVTITNNATNNPLQNIAISFSGGNSGNFTTSGSTCGATLAGGASCTIQVYFNPTWSANGFGTTLVVTGGYPRMQPGDSGYIPTNTAVNINIPISGNGAYSQATLTSPAAQDFGGGWYGQGWTYLSWNYRNDGNVAMTLNSPSVSDPVRVAANTCSNIAPGASCTIQLTNVWNNDVAATSQSFTPTGATIAPASASAAYTVYSAVPTWGTTSLAFGNVNVGSSSSQNITLYNYGANTAYNWAGNNGVANLPAGFTLNTSACTSVAPGAGGNAPGGSCNVVVTFTPTAAQSYGGGSIYMSAASRLNNTLSVSGTGVSAAASPVTIGAGSSVTSTQYVMTKSHTVTNPNAVAVTITSMSANTDYGVVSGGTCSVNGAIAAGGSCTVYVRSSRDCGSFSLPYTLSVTTSPGGTRSASGSIAGGGYTCM